MLGEQKIDGLAVFIYGAIQIAPLALHADVRLVHAPADPYRPFAPMESRIEEQTILDDPTG